MPKVIGQVIGQVMGMTIRPCPDKKSPAGAGRAGLG